MTDIAETFRASMAAYSRGDYDTAVLGFHPDVVWVVDPTIQLDAATYHGHDGVKQFWRTWSEVMDDLVLEVEECSAVDDHRVLALTRSHATGATSGVEVSARFAQLAEFRDGLAVRVELFADARRARQVAEGL
jgi:ketosteroid isomerase-like protein